MIIGFARPSGNYLNLEGIYLPRYYPVQSEASSAVLVHTNSCRNPRIESWQCVTCIVTPRF